MVFEIVIAAILVICGVIILLGKADKFLLWGKSKAIEEERKLINIKRFRLVNGVALLLSAACLFWDYRIILIILFIALVLRYTWCTKKPEN